MIDDVGKLLCRGDDSRYHLMPKCSYWMIMLFLSGNKIAEGLKTEQFPYVYYLYAFQRINGVNKKNRKKRRNTQRLSHVIGPIRKERNAADAMVGFWWQCECGGMVIFGVKYSTF